MIWARSLGTKGASYWQGEFYLGDGEVTVGEIDELTIVANEPGYDTYDGTVTGTTSGSLEGHAKARKHHTDVQLEGVRIYRDASGLSFVAGKWHEGDDGEVYDWFAGPLQ
jgi:hypothetical protein